MKIALIGDHKLADGLCEFLKNLEFEVKWFSSHEKKGAISKPVLRVHKRFLHKEENPQQGRICDQFRVVFPEKPDFLEKDQKVLAQLSASDLDYLQHSYEGFEDFDFIIHIPCADEFLPWAGPAGTLAIGEEGIEGIYYGDIFKPEAGSKNIAWVGSEDKKLSPHTLKKMMDWLIAGQGSRRIFYISHELNPLSESFYEKELEELSQFENKRIETFMRELRQWQSLEDYEKVKKPKPQEPIPVLVYFSGHEVTAISKLSDQESFFLTCEIPDFRKPRKGVENAGQALKTIAVDQVVVNKKAYYKEQAFHELRKPITAHEDLKDHTHEAGFIRLGVNKKNEFESLEALGMEKFIEDCLYYYFKKVDE